MSESERYADEFETVRKWFYGGKKPYSEQTKKIYTKYMKMFCSFLGITPDKIIGNIQTSERPIDEMENIEMKLAFHMEETMRVRSIHQRLNALHSFLRANGIRLTPEIMKQNRSKISKRIPHLALRK